MNAQDLLKIATDNGLELQANGDKLKVKYQGNPPTPELVNLLQQHKPELLEWLRQHPPANSAPYIDPQTESKAQALFILRECELIEVAQHRQHIARVWISRMDWQDKCSEYLQWDDLQCQDIVLLLVQAQCLEVHHSGKAIRERYQ